MDRHISARTQNRRTCTGWGQNRIERDPKWTPFWGSDFGGPWFDAVFGDFCTFSVSVGGPIWGIMAEMDPEGSQVDGES